MESEENSAEDFDDSDDSKEDSGKTDDQGRKLYKATCSDCGQETEVPFKPTEGKPVFCKECYRKKKQF